MESFTWKDTEIIAQKLFEKYPGIAPVSISHKKLREKITAMEGFSGPPKPEGNNVLQAICMYLLHLARPDKEDERPHLLFGCDEVYMSQYYLKKLEEENNAKK